ncbi:MAG: nucleotidyltransferase family protein [Capsulimonadaceae bacterium]
MANQTNIKPKIADVTVIYEDALRADWNHTLSEGSRFFENRSAVQDAMRRICKHLDDLKVPYVVVGGMALSVYGHPRFTDDVDILVNPDGLGRIHESLEGSGYRPPFEGSKNLRDTELGVRIAFFIAGEFPGDGKPKPVAFPRPEDVGTQRSGMNFINLETLIELKLASGMTNVNRIRDIADVQDLIVEARIPRDIADRLNPFVAEKYRELWDAANPSQ